MISQILVGILCAALFVPLIIVCWSVALDCLNDFKKRNK